MSTFTKNVTWLVASLGALAFMGYLTVEYIDKQIGEGAGVFAVALMVGVFITMAIVFLTMAAVNRTHEAAGEDIAHSIQHVARPMLEAGRLSREQARGEREAFSARAKLEVLDARRVERLAQQQARLLVDQERQVWEQKHRAQQSQWVVEDDGGSYQEYD